MEAHPSAEARRRAYALLAELVSRGPTSATRSAAEASPLIAAALERYPSLDEAAADHQHALGFAVPPFEGVFLDPEARAGAEAAARVHETYRAAGFEPDPTGDDGEHLATELSALAWLSAREVAAGERGDESAVHACQRDAARLLDHHLLRWLPPFAAAVRRTERPFVTALVDQVVGLVRVHRASIDAPDESRFELPEVSDLLADDETGLREVAERLATPARAGIFLSRDDVARLGRCARVPRGFGERAVVLHNLLRGAVHLDALPGVLDGLRTLLESEATTTPSPWRERIDETRGLLERLGRAADEAGRPPEAS